MAGRLSADRVPGVARDELLRRAAKPAEDAVRLHPFYRGKVQVLPKCPIAGPDDFAVWYTPGVAAPCKLIQAEPDAVYEHTNKGNLVAVVSDGSRVLGLGDIGPYAGLPVMEGKALLFKYLGGVDAVPLCIARGDADGLVEVVRAIEPSFGGVNLEDISQPKCFEVLDRLRAELTIPVWHDDQQGSATVTLAGLLNALEVVGKDLHDVKIAMVGFGAANVSTYRLLRAAGVEPAAMIACDRTGTLHRSRHDIEARQREFADKWRACCETNADQITGGIREALRGADVCLAFSTPGPDVIDPSWVAEMAHDPIVFACANPIPEIWPWDAKAAGARVVATGRSDFPNQVNNSLGFPAIFRGVLDVRARTISDGMTLAAAQALGRFARDRGIHDEDILPRMEEWEVYSVVATAVGLAAQEEGLARLQVDEATLASSARRTIAEARRATEILMREGIIPAPPDQPGQEAARTSARSRPL